MDVPYDVVVEPFTVRELADAIGVKPFYAYGAFVSTHKIIPTGEKRKGTDGPPAYLYVWRREQKVDDRPGILLAWHVEQYKQSKDKDAYIATFHPYIRVDMQRYLEKQ